MISPPDWNPALQCTYETDSVISDMIRRDLEAFIAGEPSIVGSVIGELTQQE